MPTFALLLSALLLHPVLLSQNAPHATTADDALMAMKRTDLAMSALAEKAGFFRALLAYADEGFVKLSEGSHPAVGKKAFADAVGGKMGATTLTWSPAGGEVATSGDLGYTWGNWKFVGKDTTLYGNYFSVWKRGTDGSWRLLLDGGNSTPPPPK